LDDVANKKGICPRRSRQMPVVCFAARRSSLLAGVLTFRHKVLLHLLDKGLGRGGSRNLAAKELFELDLLAVELFGGVIVLLELGAVQLYSREQSLGAGIAQDLGIHARICGRAGGASNGTSCR